MILRLWYRLRRSDLDYIPGIDQSFFCCWISGAENFNFLCFEIHVLMTDRNISFVQENESFWLRLVLLRCWFGAFLIMIVFARLIELIWNQKQVIPGFKCIVSVEKFGLSKSLTALLVLASIFHAVNSRANNWIPVARWQRATNKTAFELTTNIVGKRSSASGGEQC